MPKPFPTPDPDDASEAAWLAACVAYEEDAANAIELIEAPLHRLLTPMAKMLRETAKKYADEERRRQSPRRSNGRPEIYTLGLTGPNPILSAGGGAIRVSVQGVDRALKIANTVLTVSAGRGFAVEVDEKEGRFRFSGYDGFALVRVNEISERVIRPASKDESRYFIPTDIVGTGRMQLVSEKWTGRGWDVGDRAGWKLEEQFNTFYCKVYRTCMVTRKTARERAESQRRYEEAARRHAEEERARALAKAERERQEARRQSILTEARRWHDAQAIRSYVAHLRATGPVTEELQKWTDEALAAAAVIDPSDGRLEVRQE